MVTKGKPTDPAQKKKKRSHITTQRIPTKANDHQTQTPQGNLYLLYRQRGSSSTIFSGFTPNPAAFGKRNPGSWTILRKMRPIHRISTGFSTALWKVVLRNRCFFTARSFVRHCIFFFLSTCFHRSFPPGCGKPCWETFRFPQQDVLKNTFPCRFGAAKEKRSPEWGALVRMKWLEHSRMNPLEPKSSASTNSATPA